MFMFIFGSCISFRDCDNFFDSYRFYLADDQTKGAINIADSDILLIDDKIIISSKEYDPVNMKFFTKKGQADLPGNVISYLNYSISESEIIKSGILMVCEFNSTYKLVNIVYYDKQRNITREKDIELLKYESVLKNPGKIVGYSTGPLQFCIQSHDMKKLDFYDKNFDWIKSAKLSRPALVAQLSTSYPAFPKDIQLVAYDGYKVFGIGKDIDDIEVILDNSDDGKKLEGCFFYTDTEPMTLTYATSEFIPEYNQEYGVMVYDGAALYKIDFTKRKIYWSTKIAGLKPGYVCMQRSIAPCANGICEIDNMTGEVRLLYKSELSFKSVLYLFEGVGGGLNKLAFAAQDGDYTVFKAWRTGPEKDEISEMNFQRVKGKLTSFTLDKAYTDKGVYKTTKDILKWTDAVPGWYR